MSRSKFLAHLERAWQDLLDSYAGLSEAELLQPGAAGDWSVRDLIAHVTCWEEEALEHLPNILAGKRPPRYSVRYGGIDAFNAQAMARRQDLSLAEVLRRRDETHRRLITFLEEVPEGQFNPETRLRRRLRLDTHGHYRLHANRIRAWRASRSS